MAKLVCTKWSKYKLLRASKYLRKSLPETRWMNADSFWRMMEKYGKLIVKPSAKSGGAGVIQIASMGNDMYELHNGSVVKRIKGRDRAWSALKKLTSKHYIVQRRINLARIGGRPFDLRVMVQRRSPQTSWTVTGALAKVAGKGYIITNTARSKGYILPFATAVHRSGIGSSPAKLQQSIDRIVLESAQRLGRAFGKIRIIGLDLGLDSQGRVWIIEANFRPAVSLFRRLKDKSMYRRILSYNRVKK